MKLNTLYRGDCLDILKTLPENSVDSIITDPPYELGFMGKSWDSTGIANNVELWKECLRVLKPGGHLLAFSGTRTYHRMASAIEDAGFEVRDMIEWVYGSGFPKSLNIGKAVDKINGETGRLLKFVEWYRTTGMKQKETNEIIGKTDVGSHYLRLDQPAIPTRELWAILRPHIKTEIPQWVDELVERIQREREVISSEKVSNRPGFSGERYGNVGDVDYDYTKGTSEWEGWGTALKPAHEPICMARKPLAEKTVAENVLKYGTGGINIDESRVEAQIGDKFGGGGLNSPVNGFMGNTDNTYKKGTGFRDDTHLGRFPANLIHDGSEEVRECFPETNQPSFRNGDRVSNKNGLVPWNKGRETGREVKGAGFTDTGNASRFFKSIIYQAKASKSDRGEGNNHATVKPTALMEYLIKMMTREGQIVLDPFAGSGTTLLACKNLGRGYVGIEMEEEYIKIINARLGIE